jgi:hypothetical protein
VAVTAARPVALPLTARHRRVSQEAQIRRLHKRGHRKDKAAANTLVRRPKVDLIRMALRRRVMARPRRVMAPRSRVTAPPRKVMVLPRKVTVPHPVPVVTAHRRKVTAPRPVPVVTALRRKVTGHHRRVMAAHPADRHLTARRKVPTIPADTRPSPAR